MKTFLNFVDESGGFRVDMGPRALAREPFYIRSCFLSCSKHWRDSRKKFMELKTEYGIDPQQELKWSYIWGLKRFHDTHTRITRREPFYYFRDYDLGELMEFIKKALQNLLQYSSVKYLFTISENARVAFRREEVFHQMHIQEIMQRLEMELQYSDDLGILFIDTVNGRKDRMIREIYNRLFASGDFIRNYSHIRDGACIEISSHSYGIQIADYIAGSFMGFMKNYQWSSLLFKDYVAPKLRRSATGYIFGYGVREVPHDPSFRGQLIRKFNENNIS